jgi:hypothetical protein
LRQGQTHQSRHPKTVEFAGEECAIGSSAESGSRFL